MLEFDKLYPLHELKTNRILKGLFNGEDKASLIFRGEWGAELILFAPFVYWLYRNNLLKQTMSYADTRALYYFSPNHVEYEAKTIRNCADYNGFLNDNIYSKYFNFDCWLPPPYKENYANDIITFDKPTVVIYNKYTNEVGHPPMNYFSIDVLKQLFDLLQDKYTVIYVRPTDSLIVAQEHTSDYAFEDLDFVKRMYPNVVLIQDLVKRYPQYSFNKLQMLTFANCDRFISSAGGNSIFCSYFGGKNIVYTRYLHPLELHGYMTWYKKFSNCEIITVQDYNDIWYNDFPNGKLALSRDYDNLLVAVEKEYCR